MQKINFECDTCEARGSIRLPSECDGFRVEACPCCSSPLDMDDDYEDDEE